MTEEIAGEIVIWALVAAGMVFSYFALRDFFRILHFINNGKYLKRWLNKYNKELMPPERVQKYSNGGDNAW